MTALVDINAALKANEGRRIKLVLGKAAERALIAGVTINEDQFPDARAKYGRFTTYKGVTVERTNEFWGWEIVPL